MRYNKFMQKIFVLTLCFFTNFIFSEELRIEIDISKQRLYVIQNNTQTHSFAISSSKYGEGSEVNSFKTPLGKHSVRTMIGENAPKNTIFISRINTRRQACLLVLILDIKIVFFGAFSPIIVLTECFPNGVLNELTSLPSPYFEDEIAKLCV